MSFLLALVAIAFVLSLQQRMKRLEDLVAKRFGPLPSREAAQEKSASTAPAMPMVSPLFSSAETSGDDRVSEKAARPLSDFSTPVALETASIKEGSFDVGAWFAEDWPMKLGALLLLLGFGWLVSYAFLNNWIGPVGRISLGIIAGLALLLVGEWRIRSFSNQGGVFLVLGSTVILLTVFAARTLYDFFTPGSALVFMSLVVVFVAFSSVTHRNKPLAFLGLILGSLAPLLIGSANPSFAGLFSYLFLLAAGTLWVVRLTEWRALSLVAWVMVMLYSVPFVFEATALKTVDRPIAMLFAFLFAGLFYGVNLSIFVRTRQAAGSDLAVTVLSTLLLMLWIDLLVPHEWISLILTGVALLSALGAFIIFQMTDVALPALVYSGKSLVILGVATAYELSGLALMIAYTLEAGAAAASTCLFLRSRGLRVGFAWFMAVPVLLSMESISRYAYAKRVFTDEFSSLVILMVVLFGLFAVYRRQEKQELLEGSADLETGVPVSKVFFMASWLYFLLLIWQSLHAGIAKDDVATGIALFLYTIIGLFLHVTGKWINNQERVMLGNILLGFVAAHLLLVEVWDMSIGGRIVTFLLIGLLFMSTAFVRSKK
jgi:uncharacterized membrane protein